MRTVGITSTASYLPERWMDAEELSSRTGIPPEIIVERFGLRGKHIAAPDEHTSDMAVAAAVRLIDEASIDPADLDAVVYFGSTHKDYSVWQASPHIAHRLGAINAFALELDYMSCGSPVAVRVISDMIRAEPEVSRVLAVAACRESYLLDYENERARFMFNFGDGAVAALFEGEAVEHLVQGNFMVTDGSFSLDVKVPAGGSVEPPSRESLERRRHYLDVPDPMSMKDRLDVVSLPNFVLAAEGACERAGVGLGDVDLLCGIHMKRSMHDAIRDAVGVTDAIYLDDTGHMSGVDPLLGLDRAWRAGKVEPGDIILLLAAGTGYTWAASVIEW